jgi:hypothetical protein
MIVTYFTTSSSFFYHCKGFNYFYKELYFTQYTTEGLVQQPFGKISVLGLISDLYILIR